MLKQLQKQTLWVAALGLMTLCMPWTVQAEAKHQDSKESSSEIPDSVKNFAADYWQTVLTDDEKKAEHRKAARLSWYKHCRAGVSSQALEAAAKQHVEGYGENTLEQFCRHTESFKAQKNLKYDEVLADSRNEFENYVSQLEGRRTSKTASGEKPESQLTDEEKRQKAEQDAQRRFAEDQQRNAQEKELDRLLKEQQQRALFDQFQKAQQGKGGSGGSSGSGRGSRGSRGSGGDNNFKPPAHQRIPKNDSKIGEALANALDRKDGKNSLNDFFKSALGNDREERRRGSSDRNKKKSRNSILDAVESALKPPTPVTATEDSEDEPNTDALNDLANQNAPLFQQEQPFVSQADVAGNPISSADAAANLGALGGGFPFQGFGGGGVGNGGGTVTQGGGGGASGVGASGFSDQTFALKENILGKYKSDGGGNYIKKESYGTGSSASGTTAAPNAGGVDKSQYVKGKKFRRGGTNGSLVIDRTTEADEMLQHSVFGAVRAIYGGDLCQIQLSDGKPPGICETVEGERNIRVNSITGSKDI